MIVFWLYLLLLTNLHTDQTQSPVATEIIRVWAPHNANALLFWEAQLYYSSYYIFIDLLRLPYNNNNKFLESLSDDFRRRQA